MNRRLDRTVAIGALAAVAIVPTVLLAAIKVANPSRIGPGSTPATTAAGDGSGLKALSGRSPVLLSPSPGAGAGGAGQATPGRSPGTKDTTATPAPAGLNSYTRVTEAWLSGAPSGDNQHLTENTTMVLRPSFSMDAQGTKANTVAGVTTTTTQRVVVKNKVLTTYDGDVSKETKLSDDEVGTLSKQGDSRQFTALIRLVPGVKKQASTAGATRYSASVTLKDVAAQLPDDQVAEIEKVVPLSTSVSLTMLSDKIDRPRSVQLTATAPDVNLKVVMTFKNYR